MCGGVDDGNDPPRKAEAAEKEGGGEVERRAPLDPFLSEVAPAPPLSKRPLRPEASRSGYEGHRAVKESRS